jgi:two-component system, LuxR family, sensor kinase FixL
VVVLWTGRDGEARVRVGVRNFGVGLPSEREKIFEQFFSTKRDGLGMGLVIARSIVEAHGGRLFAENVEGRRCILPFYSAGKLVPHASESTPLLGFPCG